MAAKPRPTFGSGAFLLIYLVACLFLQREPDWSTHRTGWAGVSGHNWPSYSQLGPCHGQRSLESPETKGNQVIIYWARLWTECLVFGELVACSNPRPLTCHKALYGPCRRSRLLAHSQSVLATRSRTRYRIGRRNGLHHLRKNFSFDRSIVYVPCGLVAWRLQ